MAMNLTTLQTDLEEALHHHHVAGASAAVFHKGELTTASAGITNVTTGIEITDDTLMHIGSIAKVFTTTLIMQLVDEGLLDLDDPILQHLPELKLKDKEALQCITVKMLLNHTSGIDGDVQPDYGHDEETIEKAILRFAELGQMHKPGAEMSYCNGAMVIVGYLAQQITGKSWYDLIKEKIYVPLDMLHAVTLPEEALLYRTSVGHHYDEKTKTQARTSFCLLPLSFSPGGTTLMMSVQNLVTFACSHIGNGVGLNGVRILSENSAIAMRQQTISCARRELADGIGLGWMLFENGVIGHGGGAPGVVSMLYVCPEKEFAAAILTNSGHSIALINDFMGPWLEELTGGVSLYGAPVGELQEVQVDKIDFNRYVGIYENIMVRYEISTLPEGLGISMHFKFALYDSSKTQPSPVTRLIPLGGDDFFLMQEQKHSGASLMTMGPQIFSFKNPDALGRSTHLSAANGRLYRRVP